MYIGRTPKYERKHWSLVCCYFRYLYFYENIGIRKIKFGPQNVRVPVVWLKVNVFSRCFNIRVFQQATNSVTIVRRRKTTQSASFTGPMKILTPYMIYANVSYIVTRLPVLAIPLVQQRTMFQIISPKAGFTEQSYK